MSSHEENPFKVNAWDFSRMGRIMTDLAFYLFSIVSFALLLQWFWTFEILHDPVKAVNQNNSHYFTKVLGIVFFCSLIGLVMVIIFDCLSLYLTAYLLATMLDIWQFAVCICYIVLYCKFLWLMHTNPEFRVLQLQVHTFFLFMIFILLCKTAICSL